MSKGFESHRGAEQMRLCRQCQGKMPEEKKGLCNACKAEGGQASGDTIKQHEAVSIGQYDSYLDGLRKGQRWQTIRRLVVQRDPLCKMCDRELTAIVDHKVPAYEALRQARESKRFPYSADAGYFLTSNLQGLCRGCHAVKTGEDKAHVGPWPSVMDAHDAAPKKTYKF